MVAIRNSGSQFHIDNPELRLMPNEIVGIRRIRRENHSVYLALKIACAFGVSTLLLLIAFSIGVSRGISYSTSVSQHSHSSDFYVVNSVNSQNSKR